MSVIAGLLALAILSGPAIAGEAPHPVLQQLDRLASLAEGEDPLPLLDAISEAVGSAPGGLVPLLLARILEPERGENSLAVHVWALGLTKDASALDPLIALYRQTSSPAVRRSCRQALATVGGTPAAQLLSTALDAETDPDVRFEILALLGQMQHTPALSRSDELLRQDPGLHAWKSVMVFGAMGDAGVPYLLTKLAHPDRHVRMNAVHLLGLWLLAAEAATPIARAYWTESDPEVRELMLNAMQRTVSDLGRMRQFFGEVVDREADAKLVALAGDTLRGLDALAVEGQQFARRARRAGPSFEQLWDELYRSAGRKGDYGALSEASGPEHESRLKALRERILQRQSEEALRHYQEVNRIILRNRVAQRLAP
jgi:HEAT repeat protein